ncbi:MAG: DUF2905 domain-containing protein [Gammaproteobacteria bacterium]
MGRWLIGLGLALVLLGLLLHYAPWTLNWFGRLPGDIRIESGRTRVFVPLTSMLVVSVAVSLLLWFLRR